MSIPVIPEHLMPFINRIAAVEDERDSAIAQIKILEERLDRMGESVGVALKRVVELEGLALAFRLLVILGSSVDSLKGMENKDVSS